jgi:hypothetical protein
MTTGSLEPVAVGVGVAVLVAVGVAVAVLVAVGGTWVAVGVLVGTDVLVGVLVGGTGVVVGMGLKVAVGAGVVVLVGRGVGVALGPGRGVVRGVAVAVAVGVGRLVTCGCTRQAGPPTENVAVEVLRPCSRTRRCAPVGALSNLLLNITVIVRGRCVPRFRVIVILLVFGSRCGCTDRVLLVARATWRALQHPLSSTRATCSLGETVNPARDHTNVADAEGGMGDVKAGATRQTGPPTGSVMMAWRAPPRRSTRCEPVGALRNRVLKRTVMVSGQTGLWRRSTVTAPVSASTRTRR